MEKSIQLFSFLNPNKEEIPICNLLINSLLENNDWNLFVEINLMNGNQFRSKSGNPILIIGDLSEDEQIDSFLYSEEINNIGIIQKNKKEIYFLLNDIKSIRYFKNNSYIS